MLPFLALRMRNPSAAPWTPASYFTGAVDGAYYDISDISTLWKDTAGTTPVTADGDLVARVDDKSGNGYHFLQATSGARPTYKTGGGTGSSPYLDFGGLDDNMSTNSFSAKSQPNYLAVSAKLDTTSTTDVFMGGIATSNRADLISVSGTYALNAGSGAATGQTATTNDAVYAGLFNGASSVGYIDGSASSTVSAGTNTLTGLRIGDDFNTGSPMDGRIYAAFWAPADPGSTVRANVTTWLGSKQGRTL